MHHVNRPDWSHNCCLWLYFRVKMKIYEGYYSIHLLETPSAHIYRQGARGVWKVERFSSHKWQSTNRLKVRWRRDPRFFSSFFPNILLFTFAWDLQVLPSLTPYYYSCINPRFMHTRIVAITLLSTCFIVHLHKHFLEYLTSRSPLTRASSIRVVCVLSFYHIIACAPSHTRLLRRRSTAATAAMSFLPPWRCTKLSLRRIISTDTNLKPIQIPPHWVCWSIAVTVVGPWAGH